MGPEARLCIGAFSVELVWELAQSPLYADTYVEPLVTVLWYRIHCAAGDVLILFAAWLAAAAVARSRHWYRHPRLREWSILLVVGLGYTWFSEWRALSVTHAWAYSRHMPTLGGIGLAPLVQWIVLPPLMPRMVRWGERGAISRRRCAPDTG